VEAMGAAALFAMMPTGNSDGYSIVAIAVPA
jgi:hypothetical protein